MKREGHALCSGFAARLASVCAQRYPAPCQEDYRVQRTLIRSPASDQATALIGTWKLESFHFRGSDGEVTYPFGREAVGYYLFSASGHMSVVVMAPDRLRFDAGDLMGGTTVEKAKAAETYISYTGRYEVDGDRLIVHPEAAFFPNWIGVDQVRLMSLNDDILELRTPPMLLAGAQRTAHLVWKRV
jgi:hypothetical protein